MTKHPKLTSILFSNEVSAEDFDKFLAGLKMIEGTQTNGESPRGIYTHYRAVDGQNVEYSVTIDGPMREIAATPK